MLPPRSTSLTGPQLERRTRILTAAGELATQGGWDAVQMREVAQIADVALGTLYRYFPSKEYLLVSMMIAEIEGLAHRLAVKPPQGEEPVDRVIDVLRRANRALQRRPLATIATIRALVSGNTEIAPAVKETTELMRRIISDALAVDGSDAEADFGAGDDSDAGTDVARSPERVVVSEGGSVVESAAEGCYQVSIELLSDIWLAALIAWITGVESDDSVLPKLEQATRVLFA
ncbi:MAG TPA: TetR family transcriptional regulator [Microthrixaceae bacterium]|nr:TetR family transcriptional regulator [Microthrixaceae bacterium]